MQNIRSDGILGLGDEDLDVCFQLEAHEESLGRPLLPEETEEFRGSAEADLQRTLSGLDLVLLHLQSRDVEVGDGCGQEQHPSAPEWLESFARSPEVEEVVRERLETPAEEESVVPSGPVAVEGLGELLLRGGGGGEFQSQALWEILISRSFLDLSLLQDPALQRGFRRFLQTTEERLQTPGSVEEDDSIPELQELLGTRGSTAPSAEIVQETNCVLLLFRGGREKSKSENSKRKEGKNGGSWRGFKFLVSTPLARKDLKILKEVLETHEGDHGASAGHHDDSASFSCEALLLCMALHELSKCFLES